MTSLGLLALAVVALPALGAAGTLLARDLTVARDVAAATAVLTFAATSALAIAGLVRPGQPLNGAWLSLDAAGAIMVGVDGAVGAIAVAASGPYLSSVATARGTTIDWRGYYALLLVFWTALNAVPLCGNLGAACLVIEATTAASALLVAHTGKPRALEAGWKYLLLTTLGLAVALLGIVVLQAAGVGLRGLSALSWHDIRAAAPRMPHDTALLAFVLIVGGLAAKVGWAPVHNWLPDAHSEAPPPVSALLSAALLPSVLLVAWRVTNALAPAVGAVDARRVLEGFGLASLAIAVPFLWRGLAWKRLLAYSSLEHMGVVALGIAFGSPLALAGVAVHLVGHGIAKALGFVAATPLIADQPTAATHQPSGLARTRPALAATLGLSLGTLAGIPPSPLFVSEVLILAGGFSAGEGPVAIAAAILLALGFLGLAQALIEALAGRPRRRSAVPPAGLRVAAVLSAAGAAALLALTLAAFALPGSEIVLALERGLP